jgi:hypothetical protein
MDSDLLNDKEVEVALKWKYSKRDGIVGRKMGRGELLEAIAKKLRLDQNDSVIEEVCHEDLETEASSPRGARPKSAASLVARRRSGYGSGSGSISGSVSGESPFILSIFIHYRIA